MNNICIDHVNSFSPRGRAGAACKPNHSSCFFWKPNQTVELAAASSEASSWRAVPDVTPLRDRNLFLRDVVEVVDAGGRSQSGRVRTQLIRHVRAEIDVGALVVAGRDAPEVFEAAEHALDDVTSLVGTFIVTMRMLAGRIWRDSAKTGSNAVSRRPTPFYSSSQSARSKGDSAAARETLAMIKEAKERQNADESQVTAIVRIFEGDGSAKFCARVAANGQETRS